MMIEPRQPEGELAGCPHLESSIKGCIHTGEPCSGDECLFTEGSQAQLAFMIQQGYRKLPSEDELTDSIRKKLLHKYWHGDRFELKDFTIALLKLLGGKKHG
jgi:hypothetical protein